MSNISLYLIYSGVQHYAWGKQGEKGIVGQLIKDRNKEILKKPCAELWMGTHIAKPSEIILSNGTTRCLVSIL